MLADVVSNLHVSKKIKQRKRFSKHAVISSSQELAEEKISPPSQATVGKTSLLFWMKNERKIKGLRGQLLLAGRNAGGLMILIVIAT